MRIGSSISAATLLILSVGCGADGPPSDRSSDPLAESMQHCATSDECDEGNRCFEARCVLELCDDMTPCSPGGACIDGACCYSDEECGWCDSEDCYEPGGQCSQSDECAAHERCYDSSCVPLLCDELSPCGTGGTCIDGACCYPDEPCAPCDSEDCG